MAGELNVPTINANYNHIHGDGQYLVTGGYGAVGMICAQWLVSRGARHIVLSGSSGVTNDIVKRKIEILKSGGVKIDVVKSDAADQESVRELINGLKYSGERIRGIVHAAGLVSDGPFDDINQERIARSFGPKLEGANHLISVLDEADLMSDLDFLIMTSSISSVVGLTIQGTYASANSGLDGLAEQLRLRGIQACAIQLGPVGQTGMAAEEAVERYFTTIGLKAIHPRRLYGVLDHAISATVPHFVIDDVDWARNGRAEPANATSSVLQHIVQAAMSKSGANEFTNLERLSHEERTDLLSKALTRIIAGAIGVDTDFLSKESNFSSLGIDSLSIMEVQAAVNEMLQQELPLTRMFTQDGTIGQLAEQISEYLAENCDNSDDSEEPTEYTENGKVTS
jgi:NAD(P)-dependent dehydrogenase (short-subunit alcohol dehydrogenase family)/acyl carrier protein